MNNLSPITIKDDKIRKVFETRDIRESSVKQYVAGIKPFLAFSGGNLNTNTLLDYKRELAKRVENKELADETARHYLKTARVFLQQLHRKNPETFPDIYSHVKMFKQVGGHKHDGLSQAEIRKLFQHIAGMEYSVEKLRLICICFLKYFPPGLRDVEIQKLSISDIDFTPGKETLVILGKGRDAHEKVYLHPRTVKALTNYLNHKDYKQTTAKSKDNPVFISFSNNNYGGRLSRDAIAGYVRRALISSGIAEKGDNGRYSQSPHRLIHSFVTKVLKVTNGNVALTAELARKTYATIEIYKDKLDIEEELPAVFEGFNKI